MDDEFLRGMLPSERAERKKELAAADKETEAARMLLLREDFGRVFQTQHGKRVLAWFAQRCGWSLPPLAASQDGKIDPMVTTHNAMELSLYLAMRTYIPIEVLKQVEYGEIQPSGTIQDSAVKRKTSKTKPRGK